MRSRFQIFGQFFRFNPTVQMLLLTSFSFSVAFYMLVPYLAGHFSSLGLGAWMVGFILGIRNLSHQGLYLVGGTLGDRLNYKSIIVAGCLVRALGFACFGVFRTPAGLIVGAALSGLAGALFIPSMKACFAHESAGIREEVFAFSEVVQQAGAVIGPLIGLMLLKVDFSLLAYVSAFLFLIWAALLKRFLPSKRGAEAGASGSFLADWRRAATNVPFIWFSLVMSSYIVLFNQLHLLLALEAKRITGNNDAVGYLFALSGILVIFGQMPLTQMVKSRLSSINAISLGLSLMGIAFIPRVLMSNSGISTLVVATVFLTLGMMVAFPSVMKLVPEFAGERNLGVYFGIFYLGWGVAGTLGNMGVGYLMDVGSRYGLGYLPWAASALLALGASFALFILSQRGLFRFETQRPV